MKKSFFAAVLVPSLLIASSAIFASSDGTGMQLSDVNDSLKESMQEQIDSQDKPPRPGQPEHPPRPPRPPRPPQPQPPKPPQPQPPKPPKPPAPVVDTTQARNAGIRDGAEKGARDGRREGYSDGIESGERDGRRNGANEGDVAGRNAGVRDGWGVDQAVGMQRGSTDGRNAGANNGTEAGKKRCYDAGYTSGYNSAYAYAQQTGLQDVASYNSGYERGRADAAVIEVQNGEKAGYQAGFSQREAELERSFPSMSAMMDVSAKSSMKMDERMDLPIELARSGYTTPEERRAYEAGYQEGYNRSYRREYDDAKRDAYNERYHMAYRRAYDVQFSISYRNGFAEGQERGYREAYSAAYDSAYNNYYEQYSSMEYADQRALGLNNGTAAGNKDGFAAGCAEQSKRGYKAGYEKVAAEVYPDAFNAGKQSGIAAADKYYNENAVLKVSGISFYDENNNGLFEAGENIILRAELKNFGFQNSDAVAIAVKSERGEIMLASNLRADGVGGRAKTVLNLNIGRLSDIVTPGADALYVTFSEKGRLVGDLRQPYVRVNSNKIGVVTKDNTKVREKAAWLFSKKLAALKSGEKVIITGKDGNWYKVRKSEIGEGNWTEGYIKIKKLSVQ